MREQRKAFKDYFDRAAAKQLADQIHAVHRRFDRAAFIRRCVRNLNQLEFSERVKQFAGAMHRTLPDATPRSLRILQDSLPPVLPDCDSVTDGWLQWPVGQFIADYGQSHLDESFAAMIELTQRFSSEFAVRPFVEHQPEETFRRLGSLIDHPSPHVRRWCSEGVRPRLPWGRKLQALIENPDPILGILESLHRDPELYVRRSVANNVNDIAKDHPDRVLKICGKWSRSANDSSQWVIKHGLRTLVKAGNTEALRLVGFQPPESIGLTLTLTPTQIAIGESVSMELTLANRSPKRQSLMIDYAVQYVRLGGRSSDKVFKWKSITLEPGEQTTVSKTHPMKVTTVRKLYSGRHRVVVQVNGQRLAEASFVLI